MNQLFRALGVATVLALAVPVAAQADTSNYTAHSGRMMMHRPMMYRHHMRHHQMYHHRMMMHDHMMMHRHHRMY